MVAALALVAFFIASPLLLSRQWRLFFAVPLSVLQLYFPGSGIGGFMPPLALLGGLALWPEFIRGFHILLRWPPTLMLLGILLMYFFSLLWSVDVRMGFRAIAYMWVFLAIFSAVVLQLRRDEKVVWCLLELTVLLAVIQAVLVIAFSISPSLEMVFLHSDVARLFVSPNVLDVLFGGGRNNVLDPAKAGGLFVNGNVAGAYLWIVAMAAMLLGQQKNNYSMYILAVLMLVAAYFTGSKAVILLLALLAPIVLVMLFWHSRLRVIWLTSAFLIISLLGIAGLMAKQLLDYSSADVQYGLMEQSGSALDVRMKIWAYGIQAFFNSPILGQGFGGWQQHFVHYADSMGIKKDFPPHNTFVYLWSQSGLLSAVLGIVFVLLVVKYGVRWVLGGELSEVKMVVAMLGAFIWVFIHGMGENYGLLGEVHMAPILAMLLALAYFCFDKRRGARFT